MYQILPKINKYNMFYYYYLENNWLCYRIILYIYQNVKWLNVISQVYLQLSDGFIWMWPMKDETSNILKIHMYKILNILYYAIKKIK